MSILVSLLGGRKLFLQWERVSIMELSYDRYVQGGEFFVTLGPLSIIYTPTNWRERRRKQQEGSSNGTEAGQAGGTQRREAA